MLSDKLGKTKAELENFVNAFWDVIIEEVEKGGTISFIGIMKIGSVEVGARTARNPRTGEEVHLPAGTKTRVKIGARLADAGKKK